VKQLYVSDQLHERLKKLADKQGMKLQSLVEQELSKLFKKGNKK